MGKEKLSMDLFEIGAVKFGNFTLKSGLESPIYIDLRALVSYPDVLREVAQELIEITKGLKFDRIAGIPYSAIPIATAVSLQSQVPMIYPRKEQKGYGTKRVVEGVYEKGETVLVYDDLITTCGSKFEAIKPLKAVGLNISDIVVLVDLEQGGKGDLECEGYALHVVFTLSEMIEILRKNKLISEKQYADVINYLKDPEKWQK